MVSVDPVHDVRPHAPLVLVLCAWLSMFASGGCRAVALEEDVWRGQLHPPAQDERSDAAAEDADLHALRDPLRGGTVLVYRIEREQRDGGIERWWVTLEGPDSAASGGELSTCRVTTTFQGEETTDVLLSPTYPGTLAVVDPRGKRTVSPVDLPLGFLSEGFARACDVTSSAERGSSAEATWRDAAMRSFACSLSLSRLGTDNAAMRALLRELIQMPSLWKWLVPVLDGGIAPDLASAERTSTELGAGWILPAEFRLKGDPAFYAKLVVVPPRGALRMTGGILAGEGFAPDRPEQKVRWFVERACFQGSDAGGEPIPTWSGRLD